MFFCLMSSLLSLSLFKLSTLSDSVLMSSAFPTRSMVGAWRHENIFDEMGGKFCQVGKKC